MNIDCKCQTYNRKTEYKKNFQLYRREILEELLTLREQCEALQKVFLPEKSIKEYYYKMLGIFNRPEGDHESVPQRALMEDILGLATAPIHKYLLNARAREDYINSINDYWIFEDSFVDRQKNYYNKYGKFIELLFADWLHSNDWKITNLEAWDNDSADVEALSPDNQNCAFEIKTYFPNIEALEHRNNRRGSFGGGKDPKEIDEKYIQLITSAEKQLKNITDKKRVVTIIDVENKIDLIFELFPDDTKELLRTTTRISDELWIMKLSIVKLSVNHQFYSIQK